MKITETKYIVELEMRPGESVTRLDDQLSEFCGMVLPLYGGGKVVMRRGEATIACCAFTSRESANSFEAWRSNGHE